MTKTQPSQQQWSEIYVAATPPLTDPKELMTILTFSLRDLFGDFEPHSCLCQVRAGVATTTSTADKATTTITAAAATATTTRNRLIITCPTDSVREVRAALTFVTPPSYISTSQYRLDVIEVQ